MDIKEIFQKIKDGILGKTVIPLVLEYAKNAGVESLVAQLQKIHDHDELLYKCIIHSAYPWVDGQLERLAALTDTTIDDKAVAIAKEAIEKSAAANSQILVNVDAD